MTRAEAPISGGSATCRNCGRPAGPRYCPHCGQETHERRGPLLGVVHEILADAFSLDGRLLRSLAALSRPGRLTLRHLEGKRAPYLRPFRLYLLASLALFSTVLVLEPVDAGDVDIYIADELVHQGTAGDGTVKRSIQLYSRQSLFNRWLLAHSGERIERLRSLPPQEILDGFFRAMRRGLPISLIVFVPFLALGLKLLYARTGTLYVDHLVFALHFQSALFFSLAAAWLVSRLFGLAMLPTFLGYIVVGLLMLTAYLGRALHNLHRQRWWMTTLKSLLLLVVYFQLLAQSIGLCGAYALWRL